MKIGDKLVRSPCLSTSYGDHKVAPMEGVVIWIHPKRRFFRVRFTVESGSWVECFSFHELEDERKDQRENDSSFEFERRDGKDRNRRQSRTRISRFPSQEGALYGHGFSGTSEPVLRRGGR